MEKGYNSLFDYVYDYDIFTYQDDSDWKFDSNSYDFIVLYSRFLCARYVIRKTLIKDFLKVKKSNYISGKEHLAIKEEAEKLAYQHIKTPMDKLAEAGYPKAVALYLTMHNTKERNPKIVEIAKGFEKLKIKTPEQFEAVAALHLYDTHKLYNKDLSVKDAGNKSLLAFFMQNSSKGEKDCQTLDDGDLSAMYRKIVKNSRYGENMAKAQLGYYIRMMENPYLRSVGDYFNVNKDFSTALVPAEVLKEYSHGLCLSNLQLKNMIIKNVGMSLPKNTVVEDRFTYGFALFNVSESRLERKKGFKILSNIANNVLTTEEYSNMK